MNKNSRNAFAEFIQDKKMNEKQFRQLESLFDNQHNNSKFATLVEKVRHLNGVGKVCLASMLCVTIWFAVTTLRPNDVSGSDMASVGNHSVDDIATQIAHEVAYNHIKMKPLEFIESNFNQLRFQFKELDFSMVKTGRIKDGKLIGGRYCSIKGVAAAQVRYESVDENRLTLFQTEYRPDIFGSLPTAEQQEPPLQRTVNGVHIEIWVEKDVLMVSAEAL